MQGCRLASEMEPDKPALVQSWISTIYEKKGMQAEAVQADLLAFGMTEGEANPLRLVLPKRWLYGDQNAFGHKQRIQRMASGATKNPRTGRASK